MQLEILNLEQTNYLNNKKATCQETHKLSNMCNTYVKLVGTNRFVEHNLYYNTNIMIDD